MENAVFEAPTGDQLSTKDEQASMHGNSYADDVAVKLDDESSHLQPDKPYSGMGKEDLLRFSDTPFWNNLRLGFFIAFWVFWMALLATVVAMTITSPRCQDPPEVQWWQSAPFYQLYVRSFYDSDGDGVGDIRGIIEKMSYFSEINVAGIIVSSFYKSHITADPTGETDFGYDITDHKDVDTIYGSVTDVEELIDAAHASGLKIIFDFIPNHTGDQHQWFVDSGSNPTNPRADYYVWEACPGGEGGGLLPNNWKSIYNDENGDGVSAWSDVVGRPSECYLHQGLQSQPDLNLRSSRVQDELKSILRFWLQRGVDGFRVMNARYLVEDYDLRYDINLCGGLDDDPYECFDHQFTASQEMNFALLAQWRAVVEEYNEDDPSRLRVLLADVKENTNVTKLYYGNNGQDGANLALNYDLIKSFQNKTCDGFCLDELVTSWLEEKDSHVTTDWMTGHQDEPRIDSIYSEALLALKLTLPGSSILYYGEEISMTNGDTSSQCLDVAGSNGTDGSFCRDRSRTPMQWNSELSAGFSNTTSTWLPINPDYTTNNVETLLNSENGFNVLKNYQILADLQNTSTAFNYGVLERVVVTENIYSFIRYFDGTDRYLVAMNIGSDEDTIDASRHSQVPGSASVVVSNAGWGPDASVNLKSLKLHPGEYGVFMWPYDR